MDHKDNDKFRIDYAEKCDNWKVGCQLKVESWLPAELVCRAHRSDALAILHFNANTAMLIHDFRGLDSVARTEGFDV